MRFHDRFYPPPTVHDFATGLHDMMQRDPRSILGRGCRPLLCLRTQINILLFSLPFPPSLSSLTPDYHKNLITPIKKKG